MPFKKGQRANPNGRPPIILPEVQRAVEANKNALKVVILSEIEPHVRTWIQNIIEKGVLEGDVQRFKILLELALGKLPEEQPEFPVSEEEKDIVRAWRGRKRISQGDGSIPETDPDPNSQT